MRKSTWISLALLVIVFPQIATAQPVQTPELMYDEARTVYLGNLARKENGLPPLRWNKQLTDAARWFSWDSVENRPEGYCGHQDTEGHWPDWRARAFGYLGFAGAENAYCGYVTPEQAINGWMASPGHRANLLDPNSREIGMGYYRRSSDLRGYVTQDFGTDPVYPPVIIEDEALNTTSDQVNLYIYSSKSSGGFIGMDSPVEMMVANDACFTNATWESYQPEKSWDLEPGEGWRMVYVKSRDVLSRTVAVSDTIYLGENLPINELGDAQMSTTSDQIQLDHLDGQGFSQVQFSLGWIADDSNENFSLLWGNGDFVNDSSAWGGTALRMTPGSGESSAWVWTTEFIRDTPMVAYFRLKVSDNSSNSEVARISAIGGDNLSLKGTDFNAANEYQEFPLAFTFDQAETFLTFQFWRSGTADVYVDAVTIFTSPQAISDPIHWQVPGGNYRGQGIWLRYTNGDQQFSKFQTYDSSSPGLMTHPTSLSFLAAANGPDPAPQHLIVEQRGCQEFQWQVESDVDWLAADNTGPAVEVRVNLTNLSPGTYHGRLTFSSIDLVSVDNLQVPVTLNIVDQIYPIFLPITINRVQ